MSNKAAFISALDVLCRPRPGATAAKKRKCGALDVSAPQDIVSTGLTPKLSGLGFSNEALRSLSPLDLGALSTARSSRSPPPPLAMRPPPASTPIRRGAALAVEQRPAEAPPLPVRGSTGSGTGDAAAAAAEPDVEWTSPYAATGLPPPSPYLGLHDWEAEFMAECGAQSSNLFRSPRGFRKRDRSPASPADSSPQAAAECDLEDMSAAELAALEAAFLRDSTAPAGWGTPKPCRADAGGIAARKKSPGVV